MSANRPPELGLDHLDRQYQIRVVADDDRDIEEALEALIQGQRREVDVRTLLIGLPNQHGRTDRARGNACRQHHVVGQQPPKRDGEVQDGAQRPEVPLLPMSLPRAANNARDTHR